MSLFGDSKDKSYPRATELLADHPVIGNNGTYTPSLTTMSSKGPCLRHRPARPAGGYLSYSERLLQPRSSREAMQGTTASWKESAQRSERQAEGRRARKGKKQGEVEVVKTGSCIDCQKGRRVNRRCQDSFAGTCASPNFDLTSSPRSPDSGSPRHFSSANPSTTAWSVLLSTRLASDCDLDLANLEKRACVENLSAQPSPSDPLRHHVYPSLLVDTHPLPSLGLPREACDFLVARHRWHGPRRAGRPAPAPPRTW